MHNKRTCGRTKFATAILSIIVLPQCASIELKARFNYVLLVECPALSITITQINVVLS